MRRRLARVPLGKRGYRAIHRAALAHRRSEVPIDRLLVGGVNGLSAREWAERTGDPLRASERVVDSAACELLAQWREAGKAGLDDDALAATRYVEDAMLCVDSTGHYFGGRTLGDVLDVAREFASGGTSVREGRTAPGEPIRVRAVAYSDCYEVVDGHHRLARAAHTGQQRVSVVRELGTVVTPVQELVMATSWTEGRRELYQPVDAPELASAWTTVRRCSDRLAMMTWLLAERGITGGTYLDVAACYGWFVGRMGERGFDAYGVELDPAAVRLGEAVYRLARGRVAVGEATAFLSKVVEPYDVVSCFSLLHHFVLGNGTCTAEELAVSLDRATRSVLFLDTGQAHEEWFRDALPEWDAAFVQRWLTDHTTFREVLALGTDRDAVPPFERNYGRMLFACIR
jgi:hypothetical protein